MSRDVTVVLSNVSFPAYDMSESVEERFHSTVLTRGIKSRSVGREVPRGRPRYVKGIDPIEHPKIEAISAANLGSRLMGTNVDLWKLIFRPIDWA